MAISMADDKLEDGKMKYLRLIRFVIGLMLDEAMDWIRDAFDSLSSRYDQKNNGEYFLLSPGFNAF